jgi:hypothetical protein
MELFTKLISRTEDLWRINSWSFSTQQCRVKPPWWARVKTVSQTEDPQFYLEFTAKPSRLHFRLFEKGLDRQCSFLTVGFQGQRASIQAASNEFPLMPSVPINERLIEVDAGEVEGTIFDKVRAVLSDPAFSTKFSRVISILVPALYTAITDVGEDMYEVLIGQLEMEQVFLAAFDFSGQQLGQGEICPRDFVPLPWDYASFDLAAFLNDDAIADYMLVSDTDTPERITFDALFKERYTKPLTVVVDYR